MPIETIAGKVKRGTLCWADRWTANVRIACADRFAANSASCLWVSVEWAPMLENGTVELRFRASSNGQPARMRFDSADSDTYAKTLTANATAVFEIFAGAATPSGQADLFLDVVVNGERERSLPLTVGVLDTQVQVQLHNATGTVPDRLLVGQSIDLAAAAVPSAAGSLHWFSAQPERLRIDAIPDPASAGEAGPADAAEPASGPLVTNEVRVTALAASEALADSKIFVLFQPEEGPAVMAAQALTALHLRLLEGASGTHELGHVLGLNKTLEVRAELQPAALLQAVSWQITQGDDKLAFAEGADLNASAIALNTTAVSSAAGDAVLQVRFTTTLAPAVIELNHAITVASLQLQAPNGEAITRFLGLGEPTRVQAVVQPQPLPYNVVWAVRSAEGSANASVEAVPATPVREGEITGTATPDSHQHEDAVLTAMLADNTTGAAPSTQVEHPFTVVLREPLHLFIALGNWTLGYTYGDAGGTFNAHVAVRTTGSGEAIAAADGLLSMSPPATEPQAGGPEQPVSAIPADGDPLPATVTLYLHLNQHLADNAQFQARASGLDNIQGFAYLNIDTASLETRLATQLDAATLPAGTGTLNRQQRASLFVRGQLTLPVQAGDIIAVAATAHAPAGQRQLGFAVLNDHGQIDPAHSYNWMREFVTEGQPAVDQLLELIPVRWPVIDPALTPAEAIASTSNQLYPMSVLNDMRTSQGLSPAQWRQVGDNQKALWRERLLKRSGHAPGGSTAAVFEFDDEDWQNLFQLEAVTEFYRNFRDPWRPLLPRITGENIPASAITVDFTTGWHVVIIDCFGARDATQLTGTAAVSENRIVQLDCGIDLRRITLGTDRIVLASDRARSNREYLITSVDNAAGTVMLDAAPDLLDNRAEWHVDLTRGGTLRGLIASVARDRIHLDVAAVPLGGVDQLARVNRRFDTVYLPQDRVRPSRTYRILAIDNTHDILTLDGEPDLDGGQSHWHIPAGIGGRLPGMHYDINGGPHAAIRGYDHFDGALFIVKDGAVRDRPQGAAAATVAGPLRWNTYSSHNYAASSYVLSSLRGNLHYDLTTYRSGNAFRNYSFLVRDHGAAYDGVRDARFYFGREFGNTEYSVTSDSRPPPHNPGTGGNPSEDGKTEIRLHYSTSAGGACSSAGCVVTPRFYAFRQLMVQLYQVDYAAAHGGANDAAMDRVGNATSHAASQDLYNDVPAGSVVSVAEFNHQISSHLWVVRPDELPLSTLHFTLRWPDARPGDADFAGTPIQLNPDRLPYLHTTAPTGYRDTVDLANTPDARPLRPGALAGEYEPRLTTEMTEGTDYFLIIPEHVFVHVPAADAAAPWRRRLRFQDLEPGHRHYSLRVRIVAGVLRVQPVQGAEQDWGDTRRQLHAVALIPYLRDTNSADLTADWQRASRDLRREIGDYPAFNEAALEFHKPLSGANLTAAQNAHLAPDEFFRFPANGERSYTDITGLIYLEQLLWNEHTLTGVEQPQRLRYMPLSKRSFLVGLEALRAAFGADEELTIRTGFVPPNRIAASHELRTVNGNAGYRVNQIRHLFGDAADIDRSASPFNTRTNRIAATDTLLPWPDTGAAQALRAHFSHIQFERLLLNTGPAAVERRYVLHVDRRDYDIGFPSGVYQFRINDIRAANGDQAVFDDFTASHVDYADIVTVVPQAGATRPNAFYDSNLNAAPPHGHSVFNLVDANPNLAALLTRMDAAGMWATINLGLKNVGHDQDVLAIMQEVYDTFQAHASFIGVSFDLEWYNVAGLNATAVVRDMVTWIRANHPGRFLFPIWFGMTVNRLNWPDMRALADVAIPIYDGAPGAAWGNAVRDTWKGFMLNNSVLEHVYDSNRNLRTYGHNMLIPSAIPNADFSEALKWLGRTSRLYGNTNFAFQFNDYGQNFANHDNHLQDILDELQA